MGFPMIAPHSWYRLPRVEPQRDSRGKVRAAFVRLRTGKALGIVQPDPGIFVFVYVARDGLPVGIRFLEREYSVAVSYLASVLGRYGKRKRRNGAPARRASPGSRPPAGDRYLLDCFRAFLRAGRHFPAPTVPAPAARACASPARGRARS